MRILAVFTVIWAWETLFEFLIKEKPKIAFSAVFNIITKGTVWKTFKTRTKVSDISFRAKCAFSKASAMNAIFRAFLTCLRGKIGLIIEIVTHFTVFTSV